MQSHCEQRLDGNPPDTVGVLRSPMLGQVGELYDGAVRPGEALRLPFQLLGVRAWVDHAELTAPVQPPDSALSIPL